MAGKTKISLTVTLSPESIQFLEMMVDEKEFASLSHGVELAITRLRKAMSERSPA
jgi:Arc/MetJ-type ribon-helix-helix transcriptional regulator